jgi:hypothetical protein
VSKLLERLSDPVKSGVYRVAHDRDIRDALSASAHDLTSVTLAPGKAAMLEAIARSQAFPEWFGGNWDALEDCLADLSWRKRAARVILFADAAPGGDLGILQDVLAATAEYWRGRGEAFFAVFIDPAGKLALPALYKEKVKRADG